MKNKILLIVTVITLLFFPKVNFGQAVAPALGTTVNFALFSSAGAMQSTSIPKFLTHVTGNIGAAPASVTGFGNVDGVVYQGGTQFATATTDLQAAYLQLSGEIPTNVLASPFGGGSTLTTGVYRINSASQLTGNIILDALGDPTAVFVFQLKGALGVSNNVKIKLVNGALACNVFWEVDGAILMGTGISMKGTVIANAGRIDMGANDTLEGRALVINEAVGVLNTVIYLPIGCGSAVLTGPSAPSLASTECYGIFSSDGGNINDDSGSFVTGDIGTNGASFSSIGYDPLKVTGTIHNPADGSTALCASDLGNAYGYINGLAHDILLLEPTLFGHDLVLTPHTYRIDGAVTFTDSLYLNAQGNANAVFIIKVYGAFSSSTNSKVILMNGTQAKNVYWMINGAVSIGKNSTFNGTFVSAGAIDLLLSTKMNGRAFTIAGAINTFSIKLAIPSGKAAAAGTITGPASVCQGQTGVIYTVPVIPGATGYSWTLPAGATITAGNNTNSITVDFSGTAVSGNITVKGSGPCGNGIVSPNFAVTVNPVPTVNGVPNQTVCNNAPTSAVVFSGAVAGTTYIWTNSSTSIGLAASGSGNISSFTATNTGTFAVTATITVTPTANGCTGASASFTITVNPSPSPAGTITGPATVCQGQTGLIYSVPAIPNATGYNWTLPVGATITAGNNTPSITVNFSVGAVSGTITVQGSGACGNGAASPNFVLTVSAAPAAAAGTITGPASVCQGQMGVIYTVPTIPNATGYNWTLPIGATITAGNNTPSITVDFSGIAMSGNITVQGTSACGNGTVSPNFAVTVNPLPTVNGVPNQTVCNNVPTTTVVFSGVVAGTTYNWSNSNTTIGLAGSGSGNISSFTATNTGTFVVTATITVTPTANGCTGVSTSFTITVNPTPTMNSVINQMVCNNAPTSAITFGGSVAGTTYTWTNSNTSIGLAASGSGNISSFTATNSGASAVTAIITVTPAANGCTGASTTFIITVNSTPTVNSVSNQVLCSNAITAANTFSGSVAGTTYTWSNSNTSIGLAASGSGDINAFTATNSGASAVTATITVTPAANGCNGASTSFTITVNPIPIAVANSNSPVCAGSVINLTAQTVAGGTYSWTGPNGYLSSAQNPVILSTSSANAGTYSLIISTNGCASAPSKIIVVVNNCGGADLSVVKTVNNIHPLIGRTVIFTIAATNNGPNNVTGVTVTDPLQSGYAYVSSSTTAGTYDPSTGVWTISTLNNGASEILTLTVTVNSIGNYINTATISSNVADGNMANNVSSTITFPTSLNIPEGFSPNGDGINDVLVIRGIENYPNNTFTIFNRWGDKVFDASSYLNTWDGRSTMGLRIGGDELPIGTYFYVLDLGDGSAIFKGTIYLNR